MPPIAEVVRTHLAKLPPLSVITLDDLYRQISPDNCPAIRAALYRSALGTPVATRSHQKLYHAIRLELSLDNTGLSQPVFLSLPGVPREAIEHDASKSYTQEIEHGLAKTFSRKVVDYWFRAAQYRSVDLIRKSIREAKERTGGVCQLCLVVNELRTKRHLSPLQPSRCIAACHVISRKTVFWRHLKKTVHEENIFSPAGVSSLISALKNDPLHSSPDYMLGLCDTHDSMLLRSLSRHVSSSALTSQLTLW